MRGLAALAVVLAGASASAEPPPATSPNDKVVAVAPFSAVTDDGKKGLPALEEIIARGIDVGPGGFRALTAAEVRKAAKKARRPELNDCEADPACLAETGKLVGAVVVVGGEVSSLGEGSIVYLKAVEVATGKEIGSVTAVLEGTPEARAAEARASAFRLLSPRDYVGRVDLKVDVANATVYVDGARAAWGPGKPLALAVGTHAVRVTHEQYRDWVRFIDVKFDETTPVPVELKAYPIISDEMRENARPRPNPTGPYEPLPWYRRWTTVAAAGAILVVGTTILVYALSDDLDFDRAVTIGD